MPHIKLAEGLPGIVGPMVFSPETAAPMNDLANVLLRGPNTLTPGEREMIATYVSSENDCFFCQTVHGCVAAYHFNDEALVKKVKLDFEEAPTTEKLKSLLAIAGKVQKGGKHVTSEHIARARKAGATDKEIHDTVLIAAAFCMFNRYVDGLDTWAPRDPGEYEGRGQRIAEQGYNVRPENFPQKTHA